MAITAGLLGLIGLGVSAAGSIGGAIGSSVNRSKASAERTRAYNEAKNLLNSEYYRDPLSSIGNRSLLKSMEERMRENEDAINNRAVAGGATMENQLAAKKANNQAMSNVYTNLLMGEDARRSAINQQKLQLGQNYSAGVQQDYAAASQDWRSWGQQMAQSGMSLATSGFMEDPSKVIFNFKK